MSKRTIYGCDWCGVEAERKKKVTIDGPHRKGGRLPDGWRHRATPRGAHETIIDILCDACGQALDEAIEAVKAKAILGRPPRPTTKGKHP